MKTKEIKPQPEYRWIPEYNEMYAISRNGIIISYFHSIPRVLANFKTKNNYIAVTLYEKQPSGKTVKRQRIIAHLLLLTYGPPKPTPKHKVKYKDGNGLNISLSNLEWTTKEEIMRTVINKIKKTMNKRRRKQIIIVVDGRNNADKLIKDSTAKLQDKNEVKRKQRPYLVFSEEGYEEWKTKGYNDPQNLNAEYRDEIVR